MKAAIQPKEVAVIGYTTPGYIALGEEGPGPIQACGNFLYQLSRTEGRGCNLWGGELSPHNGHDPKYAENAVKLFLAAPALLKEIQANYAAMAAIDNNWPNRHTALGQARMNRLLDLIALATGRDHQEIQDSAQQLHKQP